MRTLKASIPELRVLILSASRYPGGLSSLAAARIDGYLAKHRAGDDLIPAILAVAGGETWYAD